MGLDPPTLTALSPLLYRLAQSNSPRLVLTLRTQDPIPDWITHLIYLDLHCQVAYQGTKQQVLHDVKSAGSKSNEFQSSLPIYSLQELGHTLTSNGILESGLTEGILNGVDTQDSKVRTRGWEAPSYKREKMVEMMGVQVRYGEKVVLGNWKYGVQNKRKHGLWWTVRRGERWGLFGPNGELASKPR